jgi:hypothetical protein
MGYVGVIKLHIIPMKGSIMGRFLLLCAVLALTACGVPLATNIPTAQPTAPLVTFAPRPTSVELAPLAPPAVAAQPTAAPVADTTPAAPAASLASAVQGYVTLVLLKGTATLLEGMATQSSDGGAANGAQSLAKLIAAAGVLKTVSDSLAGDAPAPSLNDAWTQGRALAPELRTLLAEWTTQQIGAADVPGRIAALQPRLDAMLAGAEQSLSGALGVDIATLHQRRDAALATLRDTLQPAQ